MGTIFLGSVDFGRQRAKFQNVNKNLWRFFLSACVLGFSQMNLESKTVEDLPLIHQSIDLSIPFKSVEDRYYSRYYHADENGQDQVVLVHSNRICLVSLAKSHPVIKEQKAIKKLDFHVSENCNRLKNKVSGKGKKGGQGLDERSILCFIECETGEKYSIRSCVKGKLVGINQKVVENPKLILEKSPGEAHLAIILTKIPDGITDLKERLMTEEAYLQKNGQ